MPLSGAGVGGGRRRKRDVPCQLSLRAEPAPGGKPGTAGTGGGGQQPRVAVTRLPRQGLRGGGHTPGGSNPLQALPRGGQDALPGSLLSTIHVAWPLFNATFGSAMVCAHCMDGETETQEAKQPGQAHQLPGGRARPGTHISQRPTSSQATAPLLTWRTHL